MSKSIIEVKITVIEVLKRAAVETENAMALL